MGKFDGYLICTDFDGTFALPQTKLSEVNLRAVREFQAEGGLFTIASGRSASFIQDMADSFRVNAPLITMNGTMIQDERDGRVLCDFPVGRDILAVLDEIARENICEHILLWNTSSDHEHWRRGMAIPPSEIYASLPQPWYKAVLVQASEEDTLALRDWFRRRWGDRFLGSRSWPQGFEIQSSNYGLWVLIAMIIFFLYMKKTGKNITIPFMKGIRDQLNLALVMSHISTLLKSGIPLVSALRMASSMDVYKQRWLDAAEMVKAGHRFDRALEKIGMPEDTVAVVRVGEMGGDLSGALTNVSDQCREVAQARMEKFSTLLEPIMVLTLGISVGFIVLAILTPVFDLAGIVK